MFRWLKSLIGTNRQIFHYFDGHQWRYADPIVIDRAMSEALPGWGKILKLLQIPEVEGGIPPELAGKTIETQTESLKKIEAMVRKAFEVEPIGKDGRGLSVIGCLDLLNNFIAYGGELVDAAGPLSQSPGHSEASPAGPASANSADSTSPDTKSPPLSPQSSPAA